MTLHRQRTCESCGKPLGRTVADCFECGGEKPRLSREDRLKDAETWKIWFGIPVEKIQEAHDYDE